MFSISSAVITLLCLYLANGEKLVQEVKSEEGISSILEAFGYSPSCIAASLATCKKDEHSSSFSKMFENLSWDIHKEFQKTNALIDRPLSCTDLFAKGETTSGVRTVYPFSCCPNRPILVFCDQTTDGGGWTVIQRRVNLPLREDFYRTWIEYALGFGNLTGEFWLGLDNIHALVSNTLMELRIDLEDFEGDKRWAKYGAFHVGDPDSKYILSIGRYSGDAGESFIEKHNGNKFSTHDSDNDGFSGNCAKAYRGAWWYNYCHDSNLNGFQHVGYHSSTGDGINWDTYKGNKYSLKKTLLMVRPKFNNH